VVGLDLGEITMAPLLIVLIVVAVLCGGAYAVDVRARRRRRGLSRYSTSTPGSDALDAENRHRRQGAPDGTNRYLPPS
jgi:hypothetical protein